MHAVSATPDDTCSMALQAQEDPQVSHVDATRAVISRPAG